MSAPASEDGIAKTSGGYATTPTTLISFNLADGGKPYAVLILDANSSRFGTTVSGGANGYGTVFEITKTAGGYASSPTILVNFFNSVILVQMFWPMRTAATRGYRRFS